MDTTQDAIDYLTHYKAPYWRIMNGTAKVGEHNTDNLAASVEDFKTALRFLPAGTYKLKCSDKPDKYNGALETSFTKAANSTAQAQQPMMSAVSTNPYGIPDHILQKIQQETEQKILVQQMHGDFMAFMKEWPKYREMLEKMDAYLKDEDGDGNPDIFQTAGNVANTVQKVGEIKKVFSGSSIFGD